MLNRHLLRSPARALTLARLSSSSSASASPSPSPAASAGCGGVAVKRVTRGNMAEALEELRGLVREAAFVGLDLEMSGVTSAPWRDAFELDRSDVCYLKVRDSAQRFAALQLGVCPFRWDPAKSAFVAHPHNFFIFPRNELPIDGLSHEFLCQTSSIEFLAKYQFDFNMCFREGISYLSRAQEEEALQKLTLMYEDRISLSTSEEDGDLQLNSTADILFTERIKIKLKEWRDEILSIPRRDSHFRGDLKSSMDQFQTVFFKMRPAIMLHGFTSHQLKLIRQVIRKNFKDLVYVCAFGEDDALQKRVVYTDTGEDKAILMKEVQEDLLKSREARVKSVVGLRHVIDLLALEKKLIVGHNCFLDIAHVYSKFIGPLPSSMEEFVSAVHKLFPHIVDTKHLINSAAVQYLMKKKRKSLSSVFSLFCPFLPSVSQKSSVGSRVRIEVEADEAISSCFNSGAKHEAGYDAFMTGCVFAQMCSYLDIKFELISPQENIATNDKLQKYTNLLYPRWNSGIVLDLSTGTEKSDSGYKRRYAAAVHDNMVLIWGFPCNLKPKDIKDCMEKVFGPALVTSIFAIDSTAAFIQFSKAELVNYFFELKDTLERKDDAISVLHPFSVLFGGGKTRAAKYDAYRDICSSSLSKFFFADQAEAVGATSNNQLKFENVGAGDIAPSCEITPDDTLLTPAKQAKGRKYDPRMQGDHQISYEDILDSLYAGKTVLGKYMRST